MLSAETASGDYPLESVEIMSRIIERVERDPMWPKLMGAEHAGMDEHDVDALVGAAAMAAILLVFLRRVPARVRCARPGAPRALIYNSA